MPTQYIPFRDTNYFSPLICDYLDEKEQLKPFYNRFPKLENFEAQIAEKQAQFSDHNRKVLVKSLMAQYEGLQISSLTLTNLDLLKEQTTFTVTTGHQLNLFTGPLYFFYKIVSTINLCKKLKSKYPEYNFVPIYWMATEDHDFDEINFFNYDGKKVQWNREASGAVGELSLEGLDAVFEAFGKELNITDNAVELKQLFKNAYLEHQNLTTAMRYLVNALFKIYGLVIVDGNAAELKQLFEPLMKQELTQNTTVEQVEQASTSLNNLEHHYKIQVNPREINLFYLSKGLRERIVKVEGSYRVLETNITWTEPEILTELHEHPERFSPNVLMRPLYEEVILPNLCYIGGGGELAYWLQLKSSFEAQNVVFPMLLLRNSVLLVNEKQLQKLDKLEVSIQDLFLKPSDLRTKLTKQVSEIAIDFSKQMEHLKQQFAELYQIAAQTDKSFKGAVAAQETKQIKGLENLESRLLKAQKRKLDDYLKRVTELQEQLFPNQSLQERQMNFSEFYLDYGKTFFSMLTNDLDPLDQRFTIITS